MRLFALLLASAPVHAAYDFAGSDNDEISGTLNAPIALPLTICTDFLYANHSESLDTFVALAASQSADINMVQIGTSLGAGWFVTATTAGLGPTGATLIDDTFDGVWGRVCGIQASITSRVIRTKNAGASDSTSVDPGASMDDLVIGLLPSQTADSEVTLYGICIFNVALGATDYNNYLMNNITCDCLDDQGGTALVASNLRAYYKLDTNNATQPDSSAVGNTSLTVTGAVFNSAAPTLTGCAASASGAGVMHMRRH